MVVYGDYVYMGGTAFNGQSIYGQLSRGGNDALVIKCFLSNMSVVYVNQYGGSGDDLSNLLLYNFDGRELRFQDQAPKNEC